MSEQLLWVLAPHIEDLVLLPTPVLRLLNVIDDNHLYNEDEYEGKSLYFSKVSLFSRAQSDIYFSVFLDIIEDMKEECQKYGTVVSLLIPKENPGKGQVRKIEFLLVNVKYLRYSLHAIALFYRKCFIVSL